MPPRDGFGGPILQFDAERRPTELLKVELAPNVFWCERFEVVFFTAVDFGFSFIPHMIKLTCYLMVDLAVMMSFSVMTRRRKFP